MPRTFRLRHAVVLACLIMAAALTSPAGFAQQRVGVNSAVNPAAMGIPPGGLPRRLVLGQDVVYNERITTQATGQTQVLFVDESTLSIGPDANMVIDQFVYDPSAGTGKLAASLTRGVFRFVGGKLSKHDGAVTMRTPSATIGIRGGVMLVDQAADGRLEVIFVFGKAVVVSGLNGVSQTIFRPGFEVTVAGPGASPSDPKPAPPGRTAALLAQLDGRAGGNGGAPIVPTEVTVTESGIASVISENIVASIQAAAKTQPLQPQPNTVAQVVTQTELNNQNVSVSGATATPAGGGAAVPFNQFFTGDTGQGNNSGNNFGNSGGNGSNPFGGGNGGQANNGQGSQANNGSGGNNGGGQGSNGGGQGNGGGGGNNGGGGTGTGTPVTITGVAGAYYNTGTQGTATGFAGMLSPYAGADAVKGAFIATGGFGKVSFPLISGAATLPSSGAGTTSPLGPVTGTTYVAPDNSFFYADLTPVNQPSQREFIYGGTPVAAAFYQATAKSPSYLAFNIRPDAALQSSIPFIRLPTGGSLAGSASVSPLILATPLGSTFSTASGGTKALQASLAVVGSGPGQSSVLVVLVGNVFDASLNGASPPQPILNGIIHGSYLANAAGQPIRIFSPYVTPADANGNSFYGGKSISGLVLSNGNCCGAGEIASPASETNAASQAVGTYQFAQPATATAVPQSVSGAAQTTRTLTGYFGGIMTKEPNSGSTASPVPYVLAGSATVNTNAANLQAEARLSGTDPFAVASGSGISSVNLGYGSLTGGTNARIAYINDNLFALMENPSTPSTVNGVTVPVTDGNTGSNIYLATQSAAPVPTTLLANGLCSTCQYLQWGYWGGELDTPASGGSPARTDVAHINFWVAGTPVTPTGTISSLVASNFTGQYFGNLIGTVYNNGAQYLASGGLQAIYHFGSQTGTFNVSNYDGLSFSASGAAKLSGASYSFGINNVRGLAGHVNGAFYGPAAAETAGNFAFQKIGGAPYFTSGIFAAGPKP